MGTCYGKDSSRRQRNDLTRGPGNGPASKAAAGPHKVPHDESRDGLGTVLSLPSDEIDGVPLHDPQEVSTMPSNTLTVADMLPDDLSSDNCILYLTPPPPQPPPLTFQTSSHVHRALIHYVPPEDWHTCAYCNNPKGDHYSYFLCSRMSLQLLDTLMENGWWRTGEVLFKPCFPVVCCPGYALRMSITEFALKKKHRRVIRKWADFLRHGDPRWDNRHSHSQHNPTVLGDRDRNGRVPMDKVDSNLLQVAVATVGVEKVEEAGGTDRPREGGAVSPKEPAIIRGQREKRAVTPGRGPDPNKPPCRKAKAIREERRQRKRELSEKDNTSTHSPKTRSPLPHTVPPSLHDLLADHREAANGSTVGYKHKLEVKLLGCNPRHPELTRTLDKAYQLYSKFQETVHPGKTRFESASDFEWGFMNSPVLNPPDRLEGSYHMHYYLNDELIMISILDILPKYFVSIYFIYDPAIRFMTPGIYTVLVELDLVQQLCKQQSTTPQYYALGYYNSNPKVSYKAQFKPQEILCNETNVFVTMESALPKLAVRPYSRLAGEDLPEKRGRTASIDNLLIDTSHSGVESVPYRLLTGRMKQRYQGPLKELISETGVEAAHQMIISLSLQ